MADTPPAINSRDGGTGAASPPSTRDSPAAPSLMRRACASPDPEDLGPEGMLGFFQANMKGILEPFAENVGELHKMVISLAGNVQELRTRTDAHEQTLSDHTARLESLRTDLNQTSSLEHTTHKLLEVTRSEKAELEVAMEAARGVAKSTLEKLDSYRALNQRTEDELRRSLEDVRDKIGKCQDSETKNQIECVRCVANIDRLSNVVSSLEEAHSATVTRLNSTDNTLGRHLQDSRAQQDEHELQKAEAEKVQDIKLDKLDRKINEALDLTQGIPWMRNMLHDTISQAQTTSGIVEQNCGAIESLKNRAGHTDKLLGDAETRMTELKDCHDKFASRMEQKQSKDHLALLRILDRTGTDLAENMKAVKQLEDASQQLQDDVSLLSKQARRLESAAGLKPLTKEDQINDNELMFKNGIMLSDAQIQDFKIMFHAFDPQNTGIIATAEVHNVMKALGYEVPFDVVEFIVKDIDEDNSGEISFDEFCTLMAKILTPEGHVDIEGYVSVLKSEETKTKNIEMVPILRDEIYRQQKLMEEEHARLAAATQHLKNLEAEHTALANEVSRIRRGHDLSQQNWKGLSEGMREIKKTVVHEGEGEMFPHATRLRGILPSLTPRPASSMQP